MVEKDLSHIQTQYHRRPLLFCSSSFHCCIMKGQKVRGKAALKVLDQLVMVKFTQLFSEGSEQPTSSSGGRDGSEASIRRFSLHCRSETDCSTVHPKCLSKALIADTSLRRASIHAAPHLDRLDVPGVLSYRILLLIDPVAVRFLDLRISIVRHYSKRIFHYSKLFHRTHLFRCIHWSDCASDFQ